MLEYSKIILEKVSFDSTLFEKELRKAVQNMSREEEKKLEAWCYANFGREYSELLSRAFAKKAKPLHSGVGVTF